jgi:hypothetical protein
MVVILDIAGDPSGTRRNDNASPESRKIVD